MVVIIQGVVHIDRRAVEHVHDRASRGCYEAASEGARHRLQRQAKRPQPPDMDPRLPRAPASTSTAASPAVITVTLAPMVRNWYIPEVISTGLPSFIAVPLGGKQPSDNGKSDPGKASTAPFARHRQADRAGL